MNRKMKFVFLTMALFASLFLVGAAPTSKTSAMRADSVQQGQCKAALALTPFYANMAFEGCWSYFPQGQCRAIFRISENSYQICGRCSASGSPGAGSCSPISQETLRIGYWCS